MAKNDAVSVLACDIGLTVEALMYQGYSRIVLHPATRFIGTMNYGYAGTKELNEALISRFMVIDMPPLDAGDTACPVESEYFPDAEEEQRLNSSQGCFRICRRKHPMVEISTKSLDFRGLAGAIRTMRSGLSPLQAIQMGIVNKSFDVFEKEMIEDAVLTQNT